MKKQPSPFNTKFNEATEKVKAMAREAEHQKEEEQIQQDSLEVKSQRDLDTKEQTIKESKIYTDKKKVAVFSDKTSIYFSPSQSEKLAMLAIKYKKQTGKRISTNEIIRKLVDNVALEDILT